MLWTLGAPGGRSRARLAFAEPGHNIQKSRAVELGEALSRFVRELS